MLCRSMQTILKTIIVDDESLARRGLKHRLKDQPGVEIVAEAANGREALTLIREHDPDLVFLDIQMPGMDGFDVLRALPEKDMPAIVFVTAFDEYAIKAFEAHALDYLQLVAQPLLVELDRDLTPVAAAVAAELFQSALEALDELLGADPQVRLEVDQQLGVVGRFDVGILGVVDPRAGLADVGGEIAHPLLGLEQPFHLGGRQIGGDDEAKAMHYAPMADAVLSYRKNEGEGIFASIDELGKVEALSDGARSALVDRAMVGAFSLQGAASVGPTVGADLQKQASLAIGLSLLGMLIYIWIRFQLPYGVGAAAALFHDVLITLTALALTGREINLPTIAAVLTLVGYSVRTLVVPDGGLYRVLESGGIARAGLVPLPGARRFMIFDHLRRQNHTDQPEGTRSLKRIIFPAPRHTLARTVAAQLAA